MCQNVSNVQIWLWGGVKCADLVVSMFCGRIGQVCFCHICRGYNRFHFLCVVLSVVLGLRPGPDEASCKGETLFDFAISS